jgi:hypothetical protein
MPISAADAQDGHPLALEEFRSDVYPQLGVELILILVSAISLQPSVDSFPKVDWNLGPSPPQRAAQHKVNRGQAYQHVVAEQKPVEEKDDKANRNNTAAESVYSGLGKERCRKK